MQTHFLNAIAIPRNLYVLLFSLCGMVAFTGLFIPLMDNDAAHHAVIAMRMHMTGDYVSLVDQGNDYLDKPHLHFWLVAFSYKIFGVGGFAYKFPSFLFAILGVYSTYRLGMILYNRETGRLAALLIATSFGYLLSVSDVRMDAILTACIAFASWQLIALIKEKNWRSVWGTALALALGFSTKGHIAVFVPAILGFFYLQWKKDWRAVISWQWLTLVLLFFLFISPVLYCYYLQFNLHPEKVVRGRDHINGVRFILFDQVFERMTGKMEKETNRDFLFFFHSLLPAFAPWSLLAYVAVVDRLRKFRNNRFEYATAAVFLVILVLVTFSRYQLPHYLNIIFPSTAVLVASFLVSHSFSGKWVQVLVVLQGAVTFLILVAASLLNAWAFPVRSVVVIIVLILLLAFVFYLLKSRRYTVPAKTILVPAAAMIFFFFLMNANFYPALMEYQGGRKLAMTVRKEIGSQPVYFWENSFSSSFNFYSRSFRIPFNDSLVGSNRKAWLLYDQREEAVIQSKYRVGEKRWAVDDFEVTRLTLKFLDPSKRKEECTRLVIAEISALH